MKTNLSKLMIALGAVLATGVILGLLVAVPMLIYGPLTGKPATSMSIERQDQVRPHATRPVATDKAKPVVEILHAKSVLMLILTGWCVVGLLLAVGSLLLREGRKMRGEARAFLRTSREKERVPSPSLEVGLPAPTQQSANALATLDWRANGDRRRVSDRRVAGAPLATV
jgi:hypothetical protein